MTKIIDDIRPDKIANSVERTEEGAVERFVGCNINYRFEGDSLVLLVDGDIRLDIIFDCRKIYDFSDKGRKYDIMLERYGERDHKAIIEYAKDDDYRISCCILSDVCPTIEGQWRERDYEVDRKRNSGITDLWVYRGLNFDIKGKAKIVFCASMDRIDIDDKARRVFLNNNLGVTHNPPVTDEHERLGSAAWQARMALEELIVRKHKLRRIYAGLPWFFQAWSRDEAVSCGALIKDNYNIVKNILYKYVLSIGNDGKVPNIYPGEGASTADGTGWVFFRLFQLMKKLHNHDLLNYYFNRQAVDIIKRKLEAAIDAQVHQGKETNLVYSGPKETWMDTEYGDDTREGYRVEIQALFIKMLDMLIWLQSLDEEDASSLLSIKVQHIRRVNDAFTRDGVILDGLDDPTIRPNIFIAYYLCPVLLKDEAWKQGFEKALDALWLSWGGLATIDKHHHLFCPRHTGETNQSYHRGDSWYWINDLAGICMNRLDKNRFSDYIDKIVKASTRDILELGAVGCHSELSSAAEQTGEGCLSQAWSNAMFIELYDEISRY